MAVLTGSGPGMARTLRRLVCLRSEEFHVVEGESQRDQRTDVAVLDMFGPSISAIRCTLVPVRVPEQTIQRGTLTLPVEERRVQVRSRTRAHLRPQVSASPPATTARVRRCPPSQLIRGKSCQVLTERVYPGHGLRSGYGRAPATVVAGMTLVGAGGRNTHRTASIYVLVMNIFPKSVRGSTRTLRT